MKLNILLFAFLLLYYNQKLLSQESVRLHSKEKTIFRVKATIPIFTLGFENETVLTKNLTISPKFGGTIISFTRSGTGGVTNGKLFIQYGLLASVEFRYFINQAQRVKKNKTTHNHSGWYLGVEPFILSNSIAATNNQIIEKNGSKGYFVNVGFQKQFGKKNYFGCFIGYSPSIKPLVKIYPSETYSKKRTTYWLGLSIGRCF